MNKEHYQQAQFFLLSFSFFTSSDSNAFTWPILIPGGFFYMLIYLLSILYSNSYDTLEKVSLML